MVSRSRSRCGGGWDDPWVCGHSHGDWESPFVGIGDGLAVGTISRAIVMAVCPGRQSCDSHGGRGRAASGG